MLTEDLGQLLRLEGCLAGQVSQSEEAPSPACAELGRSGAVRVVYGPATFLNQAATQAQTFLSEQSQATLARARKVARGGGRAGARPGPQRGAGRAGGALRGPARPRRLPEPAAAARDPLRADRAAADQRSAVREPGHLRHPARAGHAEVALRLPLPEPGRGADLGPPRARPLRRGARRRDRPDPRGGRGRELRARERRLQRQRRPRRRRGARQRVPQRDLRPARRRDLRDGDRPDAGLRPADAAAPARPSADGDRGHLRRPLAHRRLADDGLDRGDAGPDRALGRLRDPVPGALPGGDRRG